jgi:chromosome segregation and condensation protein ScpB
MNDRDLIEAALFVAGRPLTLLELESIVSLDADVEEIVESLIEEYREKPTQSARSLSVISKRPCCVRLPLLRFINRSHNQK